METIVIDATRTGAFRVGNMIFPVNSLKMKVEPKKDIEDGEAAMTFYNVVTGELEAKVKRNQVIMVDGTRPFAQDGEYFDPLDQLPTMVSQMFAMMSMGSGGGEDPNYVLTSEYEVFRDNIFQQVVDLGDRVSALENAG